ncbi:hypothetical protein CGLO_18013 [Colletotrichum gloeosporioides Cg-14]|uniref:Uncharacterized protein n=1 Tax=Colletotrichum gloeosporioides (strain Cg-14) TaxID=1237896 RepID=T0KVI4_COLGC|nr:hypothetical protein CGLO_18013 [Colletotrichum gloeosporioides Cg-14]
MHGIYALTAALSKYDR